MRRRQVGALTAALSTLIINAAACATTEGAEPVSAPSASSAPASEDVVLGDGRDRTASQTASDWVTYADHVLVVTVVAETPDTPSQTEIEKGEGMIVRSVKLQVDKVLWSAPDAPQPAPAAVTMSAPGWVSRDHDGRTSTVKFALSDYPRLENGHTYIRAVEWLDDPCSDDPNRGEWVGLGSGGTIPFDRGVLGAGEFEGRVYTLDQARATWLSNEGKLPSPGLRHQLAGSSVDKLVAALKTATPGPETGYSPVECDPSDR